MPKSDNSEKEDNVASNSSSENDSESDDQEISKPRLSKKAIKTDSDSNESDNKSEISSSDDSSEEEKVKNSPQRLKKSKIKQTISSSEDEIKSDNEKSDNSDREKSNKSNDEKSDKSDDNKSERSDDKENLPTKKKTKKIITSESDSESDQNERENIKRIKKERLNEEMENIFGEMSDEEDDLNECKRSRIKEDDEEMDSDSAAKRELKNEYDETEEMRDIFQQFDDEDDEQQPETETRIDVTIPKIVADLGKESHFVKLPNFLSVDTHPYDSSWYEDEIDEDEILDDEGRARMKLKVENTIRWRNTVDKDGNIIKESNARIVKWSDGSMSLHLGSEIFDIHKQHLLQGDNNHLYIRQGTGLQGQSVFKTKLTFRPHSTDSFTHKKMTLSLADRSQKTQKIRVLPTVGLDPEANRTDRIKKEEDKLRASLRRENKARRVRERVNQRGPTASYLEPDMEDEEGAISLSAIKNKYKQRGANYADVYSDSESSASSNDSIFKKKAVTVKKPGKIEESDEED